MEELKDARRLLEEARGYLTKGDAIQSSEKLYKVAEVCVKALAPDHIKEEVKKKGRWTVTLLEKAVLEISKRNPEIIHYWDTAWALHVWGFHEEKFDAEDVQARIPYIERLLETTNLLFLEETRGLPD